MFILKILTSSHHLKGYFSEIFFRGTPIVLLVTNSEHQCYKKKTRGNIEYIGFQALAPIGVCGHNLIKGLIM